MDANCTNPEVGAALCREGLILPTDYTDDTEFGEAVGTLIFANLYERRDSPNRRIEEVGTEILTTNGRELTRIRSQERLYAAMVVDRRDPRLIPSALMRLRAYDPVLHRGVKPLLHSIGSASMSED